MTPRVEPITRRRDPCTVCHEPTIRHEQNGRALCGKCAKEAK
jgi:formylmethanofuran dehydrogenase subunit E